MLSLLLLISCTPSASLECDAVLSPDGAPTAMVRWTTADPVAGQVAYGVDGALDTVTDALTATQHEHLLVGLPAEATLSWQATVEVDGRTQQCSGSLDTPRLPAWVAVPQVSADGADEGDGAGAGAWLLATFERGTFDSQVLILDRQGVVRWYHQAQAERFVVDVQPALDGGGILYDQFDSSFDQDVGLIRRVGWGGDVQTDIPITLGHHMFAQLPDGGLAWQSLDVREWTDPDTDQTLTLVGDAVWQVDADGVERQLFTVWDWLPVQDNGFSDLLSIYPQGIDWTHGNALKYDEADDSFLLSLGNAGTVMTFDAATGQPLRTVGAYGLPVAAGSPPLEHQHDPTWLADDRLLVFDSHFDDLVSGAYEYQLVDGQLELTWSHESDEGLFALLLGQAQPLDDGGAWVNFGSAGVIEELDADGQLRWRAQAADGYGFAQVRWLPDFPTP